MNQLKPAIIMTLVFTVITGFIFPGIIWGVSQILFPYQANGSLIHDEKGVVIGSELIGQAFTSPKYFHPRPSAAGTGYDAANSSGTNLGPTSSKLIEGVKDDPATADTDESFAGIHQLAESYRQENNVRADVALPADSVTRSASGLDPHISPENAILQAGRIAQARGVSIESIQEAINEHTEQRFLGIYGEPRVKVLKLNLALDNNKK
jgi:K+-transporting ATPase ATPase C chain